MSDLWIETDKGRLYINGDDAVEMIVPPGYKPENDPVLIESLIERLPDLPPIMYDVSEEQAKDIAEEIAKSIELRMKSGASPVEGM